MTTIQHQEECLEARASHCEQIQQQFDAVYGDACKTLKALRDKINDIAQMMPPDPPKDDKPTVTLKTSGTPTPTADGFWTKGALVSYQIAFSNEDKLGVPGPETTPIEIEGFAGATLSNIPQDANSDYIHVIRTIRPSSGATPIIRKLIPLKMGTTQCDDT